jgi:hypothetical protein
LSLFLIVGALMAGLYVSLDYYIPLATAGILAALFLTQRIWLSLRTRLVFYPAASLVLYALVQPGLPQVFLSISYCYVVALTLFLAVAIRMARKQEFRLDSQDLLVLIVVLLMPQLNFKFMEQASVTSFSLQLAVLLYGCEYILGRAKSSFKLLNYSAVASLLILGFATLIGT